MGACGHWKLDWMYLPTTSDLIILEQQASKKGSTSLEVLLLAGFSEVSPAQVGQGCGAELYLKQGLYQGWQTAEVSGLEHA